ncbi:PIN domain-containing protein [Deferrisoma camini]|uniref:PIN domain-containing protein n=1 Tax=Deferrisoma camini TaxID=1035120 RepID=UPI001FE1D2D6|nr:PIN domain-containing protein [Deferrisoma camini]
MDLAATGRVTGYLAAHCVTTVYYLLRRRVGADRARQLTTHLLERIRVAPVTQGVVEAALASRFSDLEDAVCHAAAEAVGAERIVTRNPNDFRKGRTPAVLPEPFVHWAEGAASNPRR